MVPLRHNRDFLVLWSSQLVSTLGSQVSLVAFPLLVLATTGSPARAGVVGFANTIPALLFYLPAGVLVDRQDRRKLMVAMTRSARSRWAAFRRRWRSDTSRSSRSSRWPSCRAR
jgi:hypothetical protein